MRKFLWILVCLLMFVGCNNEDVCQNEANSELVTVNAIIADESNARVALSEGKDSNEQDIVKVTWEATENFSVIRGNENQTFIKKTEGNTFTGIKPTAGEGSFYAFYPTTTVTDATTVPYDLSTQDGTLDKKNVYMRAVSGNGDSYTFKHLTSIVKFTLAGLEGNISSIEIKSDGLAAKGTVDITNEETVYTASSENANVITLTTTSNEFYLFMPSMAQGWKLNFKVSTSTSVFGGVLTHSSKAIEAGKYYTATVVMRDIVVTNSTVASSSLVGGGTKGEPYLIQSSSDLIKLRDDINAENNIDAYYELTTDLIVASDVWMPIGGWSNSKSKPINFQGNFNGGGYTVSGKLVSQYSDGSASTPHWFGFFGIAQNATIANLNMDALVTGGCGALSFTGSIAGSMSSCTLSNCVNNGAVNGNKTTSVNTPSQTGGLVGDANNSIISSCRNNGNVTGGEGTMCWTGGIVGRGYNLTACENYGIVTGGYSGGYSTTGTDTGGLVGQLSNGGVVLQSINKGTVIAGTGSILNTGGLVGYNIGSVCTCCIDESNYSGGAIGYGNIQALIDGCTFH